ncbi:MAG TPA: TMEM43 family protein [Stellaceae bacterium]|nr:TMEM43 family protein [Stellaceae bacterium]
MSDQFTEVTSQGYFSRLGGSFFGVLIGFVLVAGSVFLLYWNEGRAVQAIGALERAQKEVVEIKADPADGAANTRLVHVSGDMTAAQPARDAKFGVTGPGLARLRRTAEMYQWKQEEHEESHTSVGGTKTTEKTYTYTKVWSEEPIDSSSFKADNHRNPPMPVRSETFDGGDVKLGAYRLEPSVLDQVDAFKPFDGSGGEAPAGWRRDGDEFYHGAGPGSPAIGDVRVRFTAVPGQTISVVAKLAGGALVEYRDPDGYRIALVEPGTVSADELFKAKQQEENLWTWILRGAGFVLMLIGFMLIAGPISMVLAFLPFLEGIAETGVFIVAVTISVPLTLVVVAVAWIAHRPVYGIGLLVAAVGAFILFRRMHKRPVAVAARPGTTPFMPPGMTS